MGDYIFVEHQTERELTRLRQIEAALDTHSQGLISRTGLAEGWHCLEVGAGAGSILRWLGESVGPTGHAVGIDKNAAHLKPLQAAPFEVIEADVRDLHCPTGFDLIHARYVLIHNRDADAIIVHLKGLLRPGGYLVLEEPDFESAEWLDEAYRSAGQRVNRAICAMFAALSLDPGFGKRLPMRLSRQGLPVTHIDARAHLEPGAGPVALVMSESAAALRDKYLATGEATRGDIERYNHGTRDPTSWAIYYSTVGIIARKT